MGSGLLRFQSFVGCGGAEQDTVVGEMLTAGPLKSDHEVTYFKVLPLGVIHVDDDSTLVHHYQAVAVSQGYLHVVSYHHRRYLLR